MTGSLRKVHAGEPVKLSASTWNTLMDSARWVQGQRASAVRKPAQPAARPELVLVRNDSGTDRDRFDILGVAGPLITPTDNAGEFQNRIALSGVVPTEDHAGRFVVLAEPVADGKIGKAWVHGTCQVRVAIADEAHTTADVDTSDPSRLASSASGSAVLLWVQPEADRDTPGVAWAIARLGGGGSGGSSAGGTTTAAGGKLAMLTHVQRYSADGPRLPAYVWREAQIDIATGGATANDAGDGTYAIPQCTELLEGLTDATCAVMTSPVAGKNLINGTVSDGLYSFRITAAPAQPQHNVTGYEISITDEAGVVPGVRRKYGYKTFGPDDALAFDVTAVPGTSDTSYLFIWVITQTASGDVRNFYAIRIDRNGTPAYVAHITPVTLEDESWPMAAPADGDTIDPTDVASGQTNLTVAWPAKTDATSYWVYVGTTPGGADIHDSGEIAGTETAHVCPGVPADGTTFYIQVWYDLSGTWTTYAANTYQCRLAQPDRRCLLVDDINQISLEAQGGLAGITEIPDGDEDAETALDVPILAIVHELTDAAGQAWFVATRIEQDFFGLVTDQGPADEPDYADQRYWVTLAKPQTTSAAKDAAVELETVTGDRAKVLTVTNLAEARDGGHALLPGTPVRVQQVRMPDKPWLTRFVMHAGAPAASSGTAFLAMLRTEGPNGEGDFSDARYWAHEVRDHGGSGATDRMTLATIPVEEGGRWVCAHNLVELFTGYNTTLGDHLILRNVGWTPPTRIVEVHPITISGKTRYVFNSHPGQLKPMYGFLAYCLDDNDCPEGTWYRMVGPAGFRNQATPTGCSKQ